MPPRDAAHMPGSATREREFPSFLRSLVRPVRATPDERARTLPGDALIAHPVASLDHAITIRRPRREVWPWLAQMGATDAFTLLAFEPGRSLVLGWTMPDGIPRTTWAFVRDDEGPDATRLMVRARGGPGDCHHLPWWPARLIVMAIHFVMQRRQLLGIARRVERAAARRRTSCP